MTFDQTHESPSDVEFPCILLSYQTSVYAAFAPLPLLNGSTSNPKDVFFGRDSSLFDGPIDDFIYAVTQSLNIRNDVVLEFQDMQLQLHSDSYMTNSLSLRGIHKVYTDMRIGQNYLGKIPPLKIKILEMLSCFRRQFDRLKQVNQEALAKKVKNPYIDKGDCENPISIDDDLKFTTDEVIVIDDEDDLDDGKKVTGKITRPFHRNKKRTIIVQKDLRGSSSILRFTRFK